MNLLDLLIQGTAESEAPERYFWWGGLAAISAIVKKNVFINRFYYTLYPNIYVALVSARSGLRKGAVISIVKGLIESANNTRVISGCSSIQGLISELSQQKTFEDGTVISKAQGILLSDEFESFLTEDPRALTYLTALHNTHEHEKEWTKRLKSAPLESLKEPCITLLVASNEALFDSVVKSKDIEGGFIARTFIVHESKRKMVNDLTDEPIIKLDKEAIINRLQEIKNLKGEFLWTLEAKARYKQWYSSLAGLNTEDKTGTLDRLGDQVLKVTMLISLSYSNELTLRAEDIELAIAQCESCVAGVNQISVAAITGNTEQDQSVPRVLKALITAPDQTISRKLLLQKTGLDSLVISRSLETLEEKGVIEKPFRNAKKEICYKMNKEHFDMYQRFKAEIN